MESEFLNAGQIRAATFVRHVEIHDTLGSTNDRAAELAREANIELPALVVARHQTAGRGRSQKTWWSADGALTFSLLLEPAAMGISTANWPQLSLATAVAVCDALINQVPQARIGIKWPNDVFVDGGKVAGILVESPGGPAPANGRLIIGIGVNINNLPHNAPTDSVGIGIALCDIAGKHCELQPMLVALLRSMEQRLIQQAANDPVLPQTWQRLCWLAGRDVRVELHNRSLTGRCGGIAEDGALVVKTPLRIERIYTGSVVRGEWPAGE